MRITPVFRHLALTGAFVAAALAMHVPAAAELTLTTEAGFVSRHEMVVKATPTQVWLALISPAGWWRSEHTWSGDSKNLSLTPQAGGCFCETIPEVDEPGRFTLQGSVEHMRVIQAYPEQAMRMQGALGPLQSEPVMGVLTIAISKVDGGTRIVWEYNVGGSMRYEVPVIAKAVDGVMGVQLAALGELLGPVAMTDTDAAVAKQAGEAVVAAPNADAAAGVAAPKGNPAPVIRPLPTLKSAPLMKPASTPEPKPSLKLMPKPAPTPALKPPVKPATKPSSVDDAFGDLEDGKPGR